ncbi:NAD(P)/FAD-dependent oxidoreductase [Spirosoma spitsbergense]|uniref:NAD(P)/FAD-dependent oxidoreductase n=1 Tax=Spirosoma spitsbergense TaxID=431554 RepID=UPI00037843C0|nr:FAD-dependent oxidoreductase [Spirosoma spitsbergense]
MPCDADVIIIGGGLAGLVAGIHLSQKNFRVILIEKQSYPHHKVCGEYVSNEVLPYLDQLRVSVDTLNPSRINRFQLSTASGKSVESKLPLGGFGVSRYRLDDLLYQKAVLSGVQTIQNQAEAVQFHDNQFTVATTGGQTYTAKLVIGAYGKRSILDKQLNRPFIQQASPWLGVKAHYRADIPNDQVSLHNFEGGYCGLSQVEDGIVNACYLAHYNSFKQYKNVAEFQERVLRKNPFLNRFFASATPLFDKPLVISQISFSKKQPVENHVLMSGDTAGLIHPLCGNGMAMAIHSAKILSELIETHYQPHAFDRATLEKQYTLAWTNEFNKRLTAGRALQYVLQSPLATSLVMQGVQLTPGILPLIIKQTHGNPLVAA